MKCFVIGLTDYIDFQETLNRALNLLKKEEIVSVSYSTSIDNDARNAMQERLYSAVIIYKK